MSSNTSQIPMRRGHSVLTHTKPAWMERGPALVADVAVNVLTARARETSDVTNQVGRISVTSQSLRFSFLPVSKLHTRYNGVSCLYLKISPSIRNNPCFDGMLLDLNFQRTGFCVCLFALLILHCVGVTFKSQHIIDFE